MAIFRFEAKIISRGSARSTVQAAGYQSGNFANNGKSAVSAAAYRAGAELLDERTGKRVDFTKKRGVLGAEILVPDGTTSIFKDRSKLWNAVELIERRRDAQLARDFIVSLPHELTHEQHVKLIREFVKTQFCDQGYIADVAYHAPDRAGDQRNAHAHILVPIRHIEGSDFARRKRRPETGEHPAKAWADELMRLRVAWAEIANAHLAAAGLDIRIDHRSLKEQGIDREPEPKMGPLATQIEREGRESRAGQDRREVLERNAERVVLKAELAAAAAEEAQLVDLVVRRLRSGDVKPEPVTPDDLKKQFEQEQDALLQLQQKDEQIQQLREQHEAKIQAFKREQEAQAEEAKKQREQIAQNEAARQQEGEITNARARYSVALADHYDVRNPYGSLARAAMAEYGELVKGQEQLRIAIAKEPDHEKRRLLELRKDIEAHDYMAISSQRLAGISASIAGRKDAPQAVLHAARGDAYAERSAELRKERAELIAVRQMEGQGQMPGLQTNGPARKAEQKESAANDASAGQRQTQQQTGIDPSPGKPVEPRRTETTARGDDKKREEENRAKVTGRKEGDEELSDAQQAKLEKLNATRAKYAEHNAQKQRDRDKGGGGRSR